MFLETIREGVREPNVLCRALHDLQPLVLVTRCLDDAIYDSRHPQNDIHNRICVQKKHAPDFAFDTLALTALAPTWTGRTRRWKRRGRRGEAGGGDRETSVHSKKLAFTFGWRRRCLVCCQFKVRAISTAG